ILHEMRIERPGMGDPWHRRVPAGSGDQHPEAVDDVEQGDKSGEETAHGDLLRPRRTGTRGSDIRAEIFRMKRLRRTTKRIADKSPWHRHIEPLNSRLPGVPAFRHARVRSQKTSRRPVPFWTSIWIAQRGRTKGFSSDFRRERSGNDGFAQRFRPVRD